MLVVADDNALARRQAARLHDDAPVGERFDISAGGAVVRERLGARRGDAVADHERLAECLACLKLRGCGGRSVAKDPLCRQEVDQAERLRVVHRGEVEVDAVLFCRFGETVDVLHAHRQFGRDRCRTSIPRRDEDLVHARALAELPRDGVLARPLSNEKYSAAH